MLTPHQGFTYNKFEKPNDWPKLDKTFDYKYNNGKLVSGNEHIYLAGPVTYTKFGSPTIKYNIVSGFNNNVYLDSSTTFDITQPFEIFLDITGYSYTNKAQYVFGCTGLTKSFGVYIASSGSSLYLYYGNEVYDRIARNLVVGDPFTLKISSDGTTVTFVVTQGNTSQTTTKEFSSFDTTGNAIVRFGAFWGASQTFTSGYIDISNSYVKVAGKLWLYQVYSTKDKVAVPAGLEYNNTTTPSIGWVNTNTDRVKGPVTYTMQGSPTIVNGIARGFSSTDYLNISSGYAFNFDTDFELQTKFIPIDVSSDAPLLVGNVATYGGLQLVNGKIRFACRQRNTETTTTYTLSGTNNLEINHIYLANVKRVGNTLTLTIYKDGTLLETQTGSLTDILFVQNIVNIRIGYTGTTGAFSGSIDLNETYVKVNGQPWFGNCPSEFQQFTAAPEGVTIGKDETEMLQVDGGKLVGPVGYTIVGNPNIVDGVVSGFSSSSPKSYLKTSSSFPNWNNISELDISIKAMVTTKNQYGFAYHMGNFSLATGGGASIFMVYIPGQNRYDIPYSENTYYNIRVNLKDNVWSIYVDNVLKKTYELTSQITDSTSPFGFGNTYIGANSAGFQGSIDLNETYIKVNGKLWFGKDTWTPSTYTDNAIYLLGSHSTDYSNYNTFEFTPTVSDDANYDVWIDNQKLFENENGGTSINWQNLGLTTGYSITTPSTLKAHAIKIVPTNSSKSIIGFNTKTNE